MLICRVGAGSLFDDTHRARIILLLLDELKIARRASPKSAFQEKYVQISQSGYGNARCTKFHPRADGSIDHPVGQRRDHARSNFNMQHLTITAAAFLVQSQTTPIAWMPAIVDLNLLPDMGRMALR
jgi:hypothetical protein